MTVLPILERELRVRARSRASYWARFGLAAIAILIGLPPLAWVGPFSNPASVGQGTFTAMITAGFLLSCAACLLTAESISAERREGTLGLLLLTRVRDFDVLLGKFVSSGMTGFLALMTFLPVLMVPVLAGGVTGGEAVRKGMVLLDTLFLALSAGLFASARGVERFLTARNAVLIMLALVLGPELPSAVVYGSWLKWVSPLGTLLAAGDRRYKSAAGPYWISLLLVHAVGWGLFLGALYSMRARPMNEGLEPEKPPVGSAADSGVERVGSAEAVLPRLREVSRTTRQPWRDSTDSASPLHWRLRRQRGLKPMLWLTVFINLLQYILYSVFGRVGALTGYVAVYWSVGLVVTAISGAIFAWVTSRFFIEARRTGELELLLTTPRGADGIVSAQWQVLKELVRWPVAVSLLPSLLQASLFLTPRLFRFQSDWWAPVYALSMVASAIATVFGVGALCWLGMWFGLRSSGQAQAILWTVGLVRLAPLALTIIWSVLSRMVISLFASPNSVAHLVSGSLLPNLAEIALFFGLISLARNQFGKALMGADPLNFRAVIYRLLARCRASFRLAKDWPPVS